MITGTFILGAIIAIAIIAIIATGYVKAPPDEAYIISGFKKPKILIGKAGVKIPFLERKDRLIIKQISVDIKTNGAIPTADFIGVDVDAVAKVKIKTDEAGIALAMKNFLNMNEAQIINALTDSLQGNMREIIGTIPLKDICNDRKKFGDEVQDKAQKDMGALGIEILSCNIQRVEDENGLINALGQDNMSQIQKGASIAKANAQKEVAIAEAEAKRLANEAEVESQRAIAERNNELAIKKAELKRASDKEQAIADAAYQIQQEEQRKMIEQTTADANLVKLEKEIELKERSVAIKEKTLDAEIKKQAEAEKYATQQKADAELYETQRSSEAELYERQKQAEAERFEAEQKAEAEKARAEALKIAMEKEAEGIKAKGLAEAEAIKAKAVAEAEGIEKKAEAMQKYGEAAILEMFFKAFPEAVKNAAEPLGNVDSITMYGNGNNEQMVGSIMNTVNQVTDGIKGSTGLDLKSILAGAIGTKFLTNTTKNDEKDVKIVEVEKVKEVIAPKKEAVATPKKEVVNTEKKPVVAPKKEAVATPEKAVINAPKKA